MNGTLHVIGAGVAGLACAVSAVQKGQRVAVYEATKQAGGRCRSFYDATLGSTVDNGSHVVLGGNPDVSKYLSMIKSSDALVPANDSGAIPFINLETEERWTLRPNLGFFPWWILSPHRRPPDTRLRDYIKIVDLMWGARNRTVADILFRTGRAWPTFWQPFSTAVMNTNPKIASAHLLGEALKRVALKSNGGLRAFVPRTSLSETFNDPAIAMLRNAGATLQFGNPLIGIEGQSKADRLRFRSNTVSLAPNDKVVLAVPPWSSVINPFLVDGFTPEPSPIVNAHFALPETPETLSRTMTGIIGGQAHWIFIRDQIVSVTVSADVPLAGLDHPAIAECLWHDVKHCLGWSSQPLPPYRIIVERRATPVQDVPFQSHRPKTQTSLSNVYLAGDWIDTALPCTLESAVRSGFRAASAAIQTH